jgi:hypothetical protein
MGQEGLLNGLGCGDPSFNRLGATIVERTFCSSGANDAYHMVLGMSPGLDPESRRSPRWAKPCPTLNCFDGWRKQWDSTNHFFDAVTKK